MFSTTTKLLFSAFGVVVPVFTTTVTPTVEFLFRDCSVGTRACGGGVLD